MPKKMTHEEFMIEMNKKYSGVFEVLEEYKGNKVKIKLRCKNCNETFLQTPNVLLTRNRKYCPNCSPTAKVSEDEFVKRLSLQQPEICLISNFIAMKNKIEVNCKVCGDTWEAEAYSILVGASPCKICNGSRLSQQTFSEQIELKHEGRITVIGNYIDKTTPVKLKCNICEHEWEPVPYSVLRPKPNGCPNCSPSRLKTTEEFNEILFQVHKGKIRLIGDYVGSAFYHDFECTDCGHKWATLANAFLKLNPNGCPKCAGNAKITKEEFLQRMKEIQAENIIILGEFKGANEEIDVKCAKCGHEWSPKAWYLIGTIPHGCRQCADELFFEKSRIAYEEKSEKAKIAFPDKFKEIHGDKYEIIGEYTRSHDNIEIYCKKHGTFFTTPDVLLRGSGCYDCGRESVRIKLYENNLVPTSSQQKYIHQLIGGELNYPFNNVSLDIAFLEENIAIEYDGGGHDLSVKLGQITEEEFIKKEQRRHFMLKDHEWKIIRLISKKDKLPSDEIIIDLIDQAKEYLNTGHTWYEILIDESKVRCSQYKRDIQLGPLRRITPKYMESSNKANQEVV